MSQTPASASWDWNSSEKYKLIFEMSPELVIILDNKGVVIDVNGRLEDWIGYSRNEVVGKNVAVLPFLTAKSKMVVAKNFASRMLGNHIDPYEIAIVGKNWQRHTGRIAATPIRGGQGKIVGEIVMASNVTNVTQAQEERDSFFELSLDLLCVASLDGFFLDVNPRFTEVLGYSKEEILSKPFLEHVHPEDLEKTKKALGALREGKDLVGFVNRYVAVDGSSKSLSWACPAPKPGANVLYAVARDVTEQTVLQVELEKFRTAIECTNDVVFMTGTDGIIRYVNPAFTALYGFEEQEVLGQNPRILKSNKQEAEFYKKLWKNLNEGKRVTVELVNKTKEGKLVDIESSLTPVHGPGGGTMGFLAIQRDVTLKKVAEKHVVLRNEELEKLNRLMVGRELQMVKLKKEVEKLEKIISTMNLGKSKQVEVVAAEQRMEPVASVENTEPEVSDRARELQKAMNLTVDRELRMVEMKKELKINEK